MKHITFSCRHLPVGLTFGKLDNRQTNEAAKLVKSLLFIHQLLREKTFYFPLISSAVHSTLQREVICLKMLISTAREPQPETWAESFV